jgi:dihydrofolate reductase
VKESPGMVSDRDSAVRWRVERPPTRGGPSGKGTAIVKLTTLTKVTIDGVMQGDGAASDEDRKNGFERGGWALGKGDDETHAFINQTFQRADAFLLGRRTYELFAGSWGSWTVEDVPGWEPTWRALNRQPKYVASTTLGDQEWSNTTVLSDDLATALADLRATPGGELQVHGSGTLIRWLLENDLVDEMTLLVVPIVLGQGARLFPDTGPDLALDLVESRVDSKGVTIHVYRPAGRPQYAAG